MRKERPRIARGVGDPWLGNRMAIPEDTAIERPGGGTHTCN